ncbi:MAG: YceI family protein [Bacteroidota bacterium]
MKFKIVTTTLILFLIAATQWAFYDPYAFELSEEPPGVIQAIGNAGSDQVFTFKKWKIEKLKWEEPGDYEGIYLEVLIDCKSLTTDWKDLEKNIRKKKDYFYVKKFPTAKVIVKGAQKISDQEYTAEMELTLKGVTKVVPVTFLTDASNHLKISGTGEINRRKFKFTGGGPKNEVPLSFEITLPSENI